MGVKKWVDYFGCFFTCPGAKSLAHSEQGGTDNALAGCTVNIIAIAANPKTAATVANVINLEYLSIYTLRYDCLYLRRWHKIRDYYPSHRK